MRFKIGRIEVTTGFHARGKCWRIFRLPQRDTYYSGRMVWWSWWRFYLNHYNFDRTEAPRKDVP